MPYFTSKINKFIFKYFTMKREKIKVTIEQKLEKCPPTGKSMWLNDVPSMESVVDIVTLIIMHSHNKVYH